MSFIQLQNDKLRMYHATQDGYDEADSMTSSTKLKGDIINMNCFNYYSDLRIKSYFNECLKKNVPLSVDPDIWPRSESPLTPKNDSTIYLSMGMHDTYSECINENEMELIVSVENNMAIHFLIPNKMGEYSKSKTTIAMISSGIQDLKAKNLSFLGYDLADQYLSSILYYSVSKIKPKLTCTPYGLLQNMEDAIHLKNALNSEKYSRVSEHLPVYIYGLYLHGDAKLRHN